jgi:hypothetical protein
MLAGESSSPLRGVNGVSGEERTSLMRTLLQSSRTSEEGEEGCGGGEGEEGWKGGGEMRRGRRDEEGEGLDVRV